MIDGGRLENALKSSVFEEIKKQAVFFPESITYGPHTIAAMHAVFSGSYGNRTGTNSYWSTFKFKKDKFRTLTEYLKDNDYHTYADIINELVVPKQGFDNFVIHDETKDDLTQRHKELLQSMVARSNGEKNFFLYLHYSNIHTGIMNEVLKVYNNFSKEFFNNREQNEKRYDALFNAATNYLESIIQEIKRLQIDKNSIIIVMSDHGVSVGEKIGERAYAAFCYDYTLKAFLYFLSEDFKSKIISQQVRLIDIMPTILDYLNIQLDPNFEKLDGVSLLPLIKDGKILEQTAYSETGNPLDKKEPPKEPNVHSIRTSKWKLIFNSHNDSKELYNLEIDPNEERNLINTGLEIQDYLWNEMQKIRKQI